MESHEKSWNLNCQKEYEPCISGTYDHKIVCVEFILPKMVAALLTIFFNSIIMLLFIFPLQIVSAFSLSCVYLPDFIVHIVFIIERVKHT